MFRFSSRRDRTKVAGMRIRIPSGADGRQFRFCRGFASFSARGPLSSAESVPIRDHAYGQADQERPVAGIRLKRLPHQVGGGSNPWM